MRGESGARRLEDLTTHVQLEPLLVVGLVLLLKLFELLPHPKEDAVALTSGNGR